MRHTPLLLRLSLLATAIALAGTALPAAEPLAVGDAVPAMEARDQHDQPFSLGEDTHWLLIAFDMGTGKSANKWLAAKGADWLPQHGAVFVANIHGMPGVGRMFALPKMRKYPHRIILADEDGLLDPFPTEKQRVTVLKLGAGRMVEGLSFWDPDGGTPPF